MEDEFLNVNGKMIRHTVFPIVGDGACLFRALSYVMYGTQEMALNIREQIVRYVAGNWTEFSVLSHDTNGDNYATSSLYYADMMRPSTYGGLCELEAAGRVFQFVFEVYRNGRLYVRSGSEGRPVKRLRFTQDLSCGHFDAYLSRNSLSLSTSTRANPLPKR